MLQTIVKAILPWKKKTLRLQDGVSGDNRAKAATDGTRGWLREEAAAWVGSAR